MLHPRKQNRIPIPMLLGMFFLAGTFLPAHNAAAATPSGTAIINQASATYADANSNSYSATSNTVTTTVSAVYTVTVDQNTVNQTGLPGVYYYAYTVTNTGNAANTFALSASSSGGWTTTLYADDGQGGGEPNDGIHHADETNTTASTGSIGATITYKFFVAVTMPTSAADLGTSTTTLTVVGSGSGGAGDDTSDTAVTTCNKPVLNITKAVRNETAGGSFDTTASADPSQRLEYRLTVTNTGSATAQSIVLTDNDNAYTTYTAGSVWIGSNGTTYNGAGNSNKTDANSGDSACATGACGCATVSSGNLTAYLGNTATESAGGTLASGSTVYVYFRVTVD